ncbi:helicase [Ectothiorhodospiraceae bacterium WFHF3C12]|nr:helicase [Ectothiorhodospiraceae bacterium WFHF3C12]
MSDDFSQFSLFDRPEDVVAEIGGAGWPSPESLPHNAGAHRVSKQLLRDLRGSEAPLLVVGYASLDRLVDFLAEAPRPGRHVRILFGAEPFPSRELSFPYRGGFPEEVRRYWARQGVSLRLCGAIVAVLERLAAGEIEARYIDGTRLHAKLYCTEAAVTLGSSNFTEGGLSRNLEANARFTPNERRFREGWQLAERYWSRARDYGDELKRLLEELLQFVDWREALVRASVELLEGEWADRYLRMQGYDGDLPLWPSQRQGIARALWLIRNVGSVLVSDATGSGKTRMGAHLVRAVMDRIWAHQRIRKGQPLLVCPPAVQDIWKDEARQCLLPLLTESHGQLSRGGADSGSTIQDQIRRAQVLAVDEAHNFLNSRSRRTRALLSNMADHTILFTATPINRSLQDLLRLVDMLGADNLDPDTLRRFERMLRRDSLDRSLSQEELALLREEIRRFTVRRTKAELNHMIDADPDAYRNARGERCRYPEHVSRLYALEEDDDDRRRASEIRSLTEQLHGMAYLHRPIQMPPVLRSEGWTEEKYLASRLTAARKLPAYVVMAALRSSRAALVEHVRGTDYASEEFALAEHLHKAATGNVLETLSNIAGQPPENQLGIDLPDWLTDPAEHRAACQSDQRIYERIEALAAGMSGGREERKARFLADCLSRDELVIAFDSRPITLAFMQRQLRAAGITQTLLATGSEARGRDEVNRRFRLGSTDRGIIALCSDSMAEGINLQQAGCMVHLDMPSVVRVAEQRVGRVDRMDSPHESIDVWWPKDAPEFALRADERFIERYETVDALLGANMPLPEGMVPARDRAVEAAEQMERIEASLNAEESWDGIEDAFSQVRRLVSGPRALVAPGEYEAFRSEERRVASRVCLVRSEKPWAFFCLAGLEDQAPNWLLFPQRGGKPVTDLSRVADSLREALETEPDTVGFDESTAGWLRHFVDRLPEAQRLMLPRKKQKALEEMERVMEVYRREASASQSQAGVDFCERLLNVLRRPDPDAPPDWDALAETWLDLIRPVWYRKLTRGRRRRPLLLRDLRSDLTGADRIPLDRVMAAFEGLGTLPALERRVQAAIVGVPA